MPIDPNIPLAVVPPKIESPTQSLAQVYALRESQARLQGTQLENTARQQENDSRTRAAADDAAIKSELQTAYDPATKSIDYQGAINRLHQGGHGTAAIKLADDFSKRQQQKAATDEAELKRHSADLEIGTQVLAGVHNDKDPENDDARWKAAKQHFLGMKDIAPDAAAMISQLPDDYASAKPHVDAMISEGTKMADRIRDAHESLRDHMEAIRLGILRPDPKQGENEPPALVEQREKAEALQVSSVARSLAGARNDAEYQRMLEGFKSQQYSSAVLNKFAPVWSKDAVEKAKALTMSEKDYQELGIQRTNAAANVKRADAAAERAKNTLGTISREDQKAYEDARSEYDKANPTSTKPVPQFDPVTHHLIGMSTPKRLPAPTIDEWMKNGKKMPEPTAPTAGRGGPPVIPPVAVPPPMTAPGAPPAAPVAPPVAAAAPQAPPMVTPPAQSPALGANVRPPAPAAPGVPGAPAAQAGGVRVKLPPDKDHPQGRIIRFKDAASANAFAKAAGFTFTK